MNGYCDCSEGMHGDMELNREQLLSLAGVCRLTLTEEETEPMLTELNRLLRMADCLSPEPEEAVSGQAMTPDQLREDTAAESLPPETVMALAPNGRYAVPRTVGVGE